MDKTCKYSKIRGVLFSELSCTGATRTRMYVQENLWAVVSTLRPGLISYRDWILICWNQQRKKHWFVNYLLRVAKVENLLLYIQYADSAWSFVILKKGKRAESSKYLSTSAFDTATALHWYCQRHQRLWLVSLVASVLILRVTCWQLRLCCNLSKLHYQLPVPTDLSFFPSRSEEGGSF